MGIRNSEIWLFDDVSKILYSMSLLYRFLNRNQLNIRMRLSIVDKNRRHLQKELHLIVFIVRCRVVRNIYAIWNCPMNWKTHTPSCIHFVMMNFQWFFFLKRIQMLFRTKCMNRKQKKMKIEEYVHLFFTLFILPGKRVSDLKARLDYCEDPVKS